MPDIDFVTNCMAGFVQLEFKDDMQARSSALDLKKKIVRYCLLFVYVNCKCSCQGEIYN